MVRCPGSGVMDTIEVGGDGSNALVEEFVAVDSLSHSAGVLISTVGDLDRFLIALFNNQAPAPTSSSPAPPTPGTSSPKPVCSQP